MTIWKMVLNGIRNTMHAVELGHKNEKWGQRLSSKNYQDGEQITKKYWTKVTLKAERRKTASDKSYGPI